MIMPFNDFVYKHNLKNKAASKIKSYHVISSFGLDNVGKYLRVGVFESDTGIFKLHSTEGTYWVAYINKNYFDSFGCGPPTNLCIFIIK